GTRSFVLVQTPEPLRSKTAKAVVTAVGDETGRTSDAEFPTISELTAERIRRAAAAHSPGLDFTQLEVSEGE
ncbi:MAG: site-specific DNA-methyltransferase, partial [Brevibacterium sp.]